MPKHPYLPLYTGDWLKDAALSRCTPAARGVWIDLLCGMHELDRCGEISGTAEELARMCRCSARELVSAANSLQASGAANVERNGKVITVCNRRMKADYERRKSLAAKQNERRASVRGDPCNGHVAPQSDNDIEMLFEKFWIEFPKGRKHSKGTAREAFLKATGKAPAETIIAAATDYAASEVGRGKFVKMPATWLNKECWNDDREAWRDKDNTQAPRPIEYKKITPLEFKQLRDDDQCLSRPLKDPNVTGRWFGTLRGGRKVETFIE